MYLTPFYKTARLASMALMALSALSACDIRVESQEEQSSPLSVNIERTGFLKASELLEASGLQASHVQPGHFFVHNDEGPPRLYVINAEGANLGHVTVYQRAPYATTADVLAAPLNHALIRAD